MTPDELWSHRLWQTQTSRSRHPRYSSIWPTHATFRQNWPQLAWHLIQADVLVRNAAAGRHLGPVEARLIDPPRRRHEPWQAKYATELGNHPVLLRDLEQRQPVTRILRRAKLTPLEADIARLWLAGNDAGDDASLSSLASATGRQKRTVVTVLARVRYKLQALAGPSSEIGNSYSICGPLASSYLGGLRNAAGQ